MDQWIQRHLYENNVRPDDSSSEEETEDQHFAPMRTFFELRELLDLIDAEDSLKTYPTDTQLRAAASALSVCAFLCSVLCATNVDTVSNS